MVNIYNNKVAFLERKPKKIFYLAILFVVILIIFIFLSLKIDVYNHYRTKGYVACEDECFIISYIPTNITFNKILLNNENWSYELVKKETVINEENMTSYYKITFKNQPNKMNNEIVDLNFCYQKQSIFKKIKSIIW